MVKILVFTEGTVLMHDSANGLSREERVRQSKKWDIVKILRFLPFLSKILIVKNGIGDYTSYLPVGNAVEKLKQWKEQGAEISYLTSRRAKNEIEAIQKVLQKYNFPDYRNLFFREVREKYYQVAERLQPDILIEDDCESIGGKKEMTITFIKSELKEKIKSIVVKEFDGIDHLPDNLEVLRTWVS